LKRFFDIFNVGGEISNGHPEDQAFKTGFELRPEIESQRSQCVFDYILGSVRNGRNFRYYTLA